MSARLGGRADSRLQRTRRRSTAAPCAASSGLRACSETSCESRRRRHLRPSHLHLALRRRGDPDRSFAAAQRARFLLRLRRGRHEVEHRLRGHLDPGQCREATRIRSTTSRRSDDYNMTLSIDRPTFINFLNANRTFFFNAQFFFQYRDGYKKSFGGNGPWNLLGTFAILAGFFQDRLLPSVVFVYDVQSRIECGAAADPVPLYRVVLDRGGHAVLLGQSDHDGANLGQRARSRRATNRDRTPTGRRPRTASRSCAASTTSSSASATRSRGPERRGRAAAA